jgi:hypothetical protein
MAEAHGSLFDPDLPDGFTYRPEFISPDEETALVADVGGIEFSDFEMRGVVARRRVAFFGASYDAGRTIRRPSPSSCCPSAPGSRPGPGSSPPRSRWR